MELSKYRAGKEDRSPALILSVLRWINIGKITFQKVPKDPEAKFDILGNKVCLRPLYSSSWAFNKNFSSGKIFLHFLWRWFTVWLPVCIFIMHGCYIHFSACKHLISTGTFNEKSYSTSLLQLNYPMFFATKPSLSWHFLGLILHMT